jgi:TATA-binding protein-associated factor
LRSKSWDSRVAAGQAIEAVIAYVPQWDPSGFIGKKEASCNSYFILFGEVIMKNSSMNSLLAAYESILTSKLHGKLSFEGFDLDQILDYGTPLLASAGKEFEMDWEEMDPKERLRIQKQQLKQRLGLGSDFGAEGMYLLYDCYN